LEPLISSNNFWLNRTAIIVQLRCKNQTDTTFLETAILTHMHSKEFFIRKAIGWSLRQYARTNPKWVIDFINQYDKQLSGLSKREALKHL
jgi:3-methyladenine DNA glycosylase AlkD